MLSVDHRKSATVLALACTLLFFFTHRSWQKFFAGKNLVTAQTQLRLYSKQQRAFGISNICYSQLPYKGCEWLDKKKRGNETKTRENSVKLR